MLVNECSKVAFWSENSSTTIVFQASLHINKIWNWETMHEANVKGQTRSQEYEVNVKGIEKEVSCGNGQIAYRYALKHTHNSPTNEWGSRENTWDPPLKVECHPDEEK